MAQDTIHIRDATPQDMDRISEIYAHYVLNTVITFELDPPDATEMARRAASIQSSGFPYLVADQAGTVLGYAYAAPYRTRPAYRFTVEDTVYLDPSATGKGLGKRLLSDIIDICTEKGFRQMIGIVAGHENAASINLHKSLKFEQVGVTKAVGQKFGRWIDTTYLQRPLGPGMSEPPIE